MGDAANFYYDTPDLNPILQVKRRAIIPKPNTSIKCNLVDLFDGHTRVNRSFNYEGLETDFLRNAAARILLTVSCKRIRANKKTYAEIFKKALQSNSKLDLAISNYLTNHLELDLSDDTDSSSNGFVKISVSSTGDVPGGAH